MERLRIGVIGLGWFGEIHCETIVGVPNLELAALCTRTPGAAGRDGGEVRRAQDLSRLSRPARRSRDRRGLDRRRCGTSTPSPRSRRSRPASTSSSRSRWPPRSAIAKRSSPPAARRRASCSSATSAASTRATAWPSRRSTNGTIGRIVSLSSRRNIPAAWTPEILNKIGPIVGDAIHDTDLMLWFTGDRVISAYAQTVDVRGLKHPDIGQTMYRFAGGATATLETVWCMPERTPFDIDERMTIIGTEGFLHVQDTFPNLGIVSPDGFAARTRPTGRSSTASGEVPCGRSSPTSQAALWPVRNRRSGVPRTRCRRSPQRSQPRSRPERARSCGSMPSSIEVEPIDRCMRCM